ncbi:alpha/beta hydrolase [Flavobacterium sp. 83]|jgi:predicted alpha/beta hydrolase family esterase|uniref:RBBP9/YdeN family alpha/beta hydrolase n=1 Tax=Flavobacterium sp. 83 TaxID=1131812 RepID=UPI0005515565|nr:alpha/beta hydrolase [Flavobacterium sp. 83]
MEIKLLIIPGLGDSGENHWQSYWLKKYKNATKVIQNNWDEPQREDWLSKLNEAILKLEEPTILVAHSLAVSLVMHWVSANNNPNIIGALLVAPADVDSPEHTPEKVWNFSPIPISKLDFPSIVVTSENDPYISSKRAEYLAEMWGSDFINIGQKGHINSESNLNYWEEGQMLLQQLINKINN